MYIIYYSGQNLVYFDYNDDGGKTMTSDLQIKQDLDNGLGIISISKKYHIGVSRVQRVKKNGAYYKNLTDNTIVFTSKKITLEEQLFHYLTHENIVHNIYANKSDMVNNRAIIPRITDFIIVYLNLGIKNRDNIERRYRRYYKKQDKFVKCNHSGIIDRYFFGVGYEFIQSEEIIIQGNYYLDDNGMPRGWGLWSIYISEDWEYYLKEYISICLKYNFTKEKDLMIHMKNLINKRDYSKEDKYNRLKYNYINSIVTIRLIKRFRGEINLTNNRILYMDLRAYYNKLLPEKYNKIIKTYLDKIA